MRQQIGNRAGEAQTFFQVGATAFKAGRLLQAAKVIGLSFSLLQSIGHNDVKHALKNFAFVLEQLNYTQVQIQALLAEVAEEYARDRGAGLVRAAFGEE